MNTCSVCQQVSHELCGCELSQVSTLAVNPLHTPVGTLSFSPTYGKALLNLWVRSSSGLEVLILPEKSRLIFGREALDNPIVPDVDLTLFDARELGVSRLHALIDCSPSYPSVMDLGSRNGTELNEVRIRPYEAHRLEHNDVLCLGKLVLYALL